MTARSTPEASDRFLNTLERLLAIGATDLDAALDKVATTFGATADRVQVAACASAVTAVVDPDRVRQALENLLANALKYSPDSAPVTVEVKREHRIDGAWALLNVIDRGPGIPRDIQHGLFERFARGQGSNGLGLGLYLARGIADAHGGTLSVESTLGMGARFTLALPAELSSENQA